eukprot:CAMPEP_0185797288 /NCGR_PEP_ID=MMETSP1174-20130828/161533_1 /TAXON_ID=35687 /ORGANISM="Dictyocha speculum, Strain CCMP1381" /LENGTH=626 /DNA_ID=CAMNT_0028492711 /DNA_START=148 /DNA_END=2028 /DNA_ORIENTATION=-
MASLEEKTAALAIDNHLKTGYRTHTCDELRIGHVGKSVSLCGWVQVSRDMNHFAFVDLRDRFGITQVVFDNPGHAEGEEAAKLAVNYETAKGLGREYVIRVEGTVVERSNKNPARSTGDVEVQATSIELLNASKTPPFLIQNDTDALEEVRMQYRYLDIRRPVMRDALLLRNKVSSLVRLELNMQEFCEIETPILIKSTPEGARDFVVPSRMNPGQFYALPQSPQTFKQLLMVAGMDRYFQIVKCFRDEELRADRQPEFTQIDCEMSFVTQEDVLNTFEGLIRRIFKEVAGHDFPPFPRMSYDEAMRDYGIDKPDLRFEMKLTDLTNLIKEDQASATDSFPLFRDAGLILAIAVPGLGKWGNKKVKALEKRARTEAGAGALIWVKVGDKGVATDSSAKKAYGLDLLTSWADACNAKSGDLLCVFSGPATDKTREVVGKWRHIMGDEVGLRSGGFCGLWVVDFPLLEWDEEAGRFTAMHHPFTSVRPGDEAKMTSDPGGVRANAYDMVINGVEVGGGSIRIHDRDMQMRVFELLGFTPEEAEAQFGFLLGAFQYGAPPHGGLAFGLDRLCTLLGGNTSIRDFIAFPKNNQGRDTMINSPSAVSPAQLEELSIDVKPVPSKEGADSSS